MESERQRLANEAEKRKIKNLGQRVAELTGLDPTDSWALGVSWEALRQVSGSEDEGDLAELLQQYVAASDPLDRNDPSGAEHWYRRTFVAN